MHSDICFNIREGYRNISMLPKLSLFYGITSLCNQLLISILLCIYINLNYYKEYTQASVFSTSFRIIFFPLAKRIDLLLVLLLFVTLLLVYLTVLINKLFIKKYLLLNQNEIQLISKLKGKNNLVRTPVIYTSFIINFLSSIIVSYLIKIPYKLLVNIINSNKPGLKLLAYSHFDTSLFVYLFVLTIIAVIATIYFMFWEFQKNN